MSHASCSNERSDRQKSSVGRSTPSSVPGSADAHQPMRTQAEGGSKASCVAGRAHMPSSGSLRARLGLLLPSSVLHRRSLTRLVCVTSVIGSYGRTPTTRASPPKRWIGRTPPTDQRAHRGGEISWPESHRRLPGRTVRQRAATAAASEARDYPSRRRLREERTPLGRANRSRRPVHRSLVSAFRCEDPPTCTVACAGRPVGTVRYRP